MSKIQERIAKLLALADSPNEHEARGALLKARELMAEYKLWPEETEERKTAGGTAIPTEDLLRTKEWSGYLAYLRAWADEHASLLFWGISPITFDEWCCEETWEKGHRDDEKKENIV